MEWQLCGKINEIFHYLKFILIGSITVWQDTALPGCTSNLAGEYMPINCCLR